MQSFKSFAAIILATVMFAQLPSCDDEYSTPECNCDARGSKTLNNVQAIVANTADGYYLLSPYQGFIKPCDELDPQFLTDGLMVFVTGTAKSTCEFENEYPGMKESFTVISSMAVSSDSLFNKLPGVEIHIIKSEDYGYPEGFGYRVTTGNGFKILQPLMPAINGIHVFSTPADAFKIAMLVAYKLKNNLHPAVSVDDLYYFKVIH